MTVRVWASAMLVAYGLFAGNALGAGMNNSPPAGAILDLAGGETGTPAQSVNHGVAITESVSFVAAVSNTNITFAFREDPAFISFSNVTLVNVTNPSGNLILNGDFSSGSGNNATSWTFANIYGASASGVVSTGCGGGLATCWYDGSVQAYDAITQLVQTTVGDTYTLSFAYSDNSALSVFSDLSTNGNISGTGGNGINILAYAQEGLPVACTPGTVCAGSGGTVTATPEPASFALLAAGLVMLPTFRRRR